MPSTLEGVALRVWFSGVHALDDVDVSVGGGETLGLIGPNGAGKTTLLNVLSGFQRPTRGTITLDGVDITTVPPHRRSRHGVVRTFQNARVFRQLSVFENVEVAASWQGRSAGRALAWELLESSGLSSRADDVSSALSYGQQRILGILRALAMRPSFLLLDEPAAGLNEAESTELVELLGSLPARYGLGLVVVEHDMSVVMGLSDRVHVLDYGRTIAIGSPAEVQADPAVRTAYLGQEIETPA